MTPQQSRYHEPRLARPDDPEYLAWMARLRDSRPARGGPRQAGEFLGGLIEECARHWIGKHVPLQDERILTWEQRQRNARMGRFYRELDAVWRIDAESYCLFEIKFTYAERMQDGAGIKQLNIARDILFEDASVRYVLRRLVYIADEALPVLDDLPALAPDDEFTDLGVVWIPFAEIEAAAGELGLELPENWREPESREGYLEDPDRAEWSAYLEPAEKPETPEDAEAPADPNSPLAQALRRALKSE